MYWDKRKQMKLIQIKKLNRGTQDEHSRTNSGRWIEKEIEYKDKTYKIWIVETERPEIKTELICVGMK